MNSVIENILERRSCRSFKDKEIPQEDLDLILKAAIYAPTAKNTQKWLFTVITNRDKIQELAKAMGKALENDNYNMYKPQVLIIPSTPEDLIYGIDDNACALENIFLAATSLGIGSCWINQMRLVRNNPEVKAILDSYGIPENHEIYGMAILGYPDNNTVKEIPRIGTIKYID